MVSTYRLAEHLKKVAHINVRNVGTVAGNLMMKWSHNDFESDVFNLLECIGVQLDIISSTGEHTLYSPRDFLEANMDKRVLFSVSFPKLYGDYRFW